MLNKIKKAVWLFLIQSFIGRGDDLMMAMLFASRIIFGKLTFADVPKKLKPKVKEILIENDLGELVTEE